MWYTNQMKIWHAVSNDGITWTKRGAINGYSTTWSSSVIGCVLAVPGAPTTYRMWLTMIYPWAPPEIFHVSTTDGVNWWDNVGAVQGLGRDGAGAPAVAFDGERYHMLYSAGTGSYSIRYATSADGLSWSAVRTILTKGPAGAWDAGSADAPAFVMEDAGFLIWYDAGVDVSCPSQIGLATSPWTYPHAAFTTTQSSPEPPSEVCCDASACVVPDGTRITSYRWTFGDGESVTGGAEVINICHTYTEPGDYTIRLTITNDEGLSDATAHEVEVTAAPPEPIFRRGNANADARTDIADPIFILAYLFSSGAPPPCADAADANDDGALDLADGVYILQSLFAGGPAMPAPFGACGIDATADALDCAGFPPCDPQRR
jgi:hypothetical protein